MKKVFVDVVAHYNTDGDLEPLSFTWENGVKYNIDKVFEHQKAASRKVGGQGTRYRCRVMGKQVYLFLEDGKWFVEGK